MGEPNGTPYPYPIGGTSTAQGLGPLGTSLWRSRLDTEERTPSPYSLGKATGGGSRGRLAT